MVKIKLKSKQISSNLTKDLNFLLNQKPKMVKIPEDVCKYCEGTGEDPSSSGSCRVCKGSGISTPEKTGKPQYLRNFWDMGRDGVTQSTIALFALCPMKCYWKMILGLEKTTRPDTALDFGDHFHNTLDKVYLHRKKYKVQSTTQTIYQTIDHVLTSSSLDIVKKLKKFDLKDQQSFQQTNGLCNVVLKRYYQHYKTDVNMNWLAVEQVFSMPYKLRNGITIQIRGKFDGVFRNKNGELWLFESKTKGDIKDKVTLDRLGFELQVMVYMLALEYVYKEKPKGVLYNLIKKPGQEYSGTYYRKPETLPEFFARVDKHIKENPNDYFYRHPQSIPWKDVEEYRDIDLDYILERLYEWQNENPKNSFRNTASCKAWNRPCEFLQACANPAEARYYHKRLHVFPELVEV